MNPFETLELPSWAPFTVCAAGEKPPYLRALTTTEGLADRFRFVAFAEKQASVAFELAALAFPHVSEGSKTIWRMLAKEEAKHLQWLLWRIEELKISVTDRPVSLGLWNSFLRCKDESEFAIFMANAEERGRIAGEQFYQTLLSIDSTSAKIFNQIAIEEQQHIRLAKMVIDQNFQVPLGFDTKLDVLPVDAYSTLK